jgi:hypothetical protein
MVITGLAESGSYVVSLEVVGRHHIGCELKRLGWLRCILLLDVCFQSSSNPGWYRRQSTERRSEVNCLGLGGTEIVNRSRKHAESRGELGSVRWKQSAVKKGFVSIWDTVHVSFEGTPGHSATKETKVTVRKGQTRQGSIGSREERLQSNTKETAACPP